jgi:hypothetical protein
VPNYMHRDWMVSNYSFHLSRGFSMSAQFFQCSHRALLIMKLRAEFNGLQFHHAMIISRNCGQFTRMKMEGSGIVKFVDTLTLGKRIEIVL